MMSNRNPKHKKAAFKLLSIAIVAALLSASCAEPMLKTTAEQTVKPEQDQSQAIATASRQANQLFEDIFMAGVMRSPTYQTYMGIKQDQDKWDDISEANSEKEYQYQLQDLAKLEALDSQNLDKQTQLSLMLYKVELRNQIADHQWRFHNYPVNQMHGLHSQVPSILINMHRITTVADAKAYIARLVGAQGYLQQLIENLKIRAKLGIIAPKFILPYVISDSQNIITGAPFDQGADSALMADFRSKVEQLEIDGAAKNALLKEASVALIKHLKPGYQKLIDYLNILQQQANDDAGAWKFPDGEQFYNIALKRTTSTDLTANQIHEVGLTEVWRIHQQMREIMTKVGFSQDLQAFFQFMRSDPQFYYPENDLGRQRYLSEANVLIEQMKSHLDEMFNIKPKADLTVKAVEPFRQASAGKAFYERPSLDGKRPGKYYVNLYKMSDMPSYQMAALAYHEGIPGHHMQIAIANELQDMPKFRKFGNYTAYVEGWGLYAEQLPKEAGFYQDPYADFGRLAMELWRACRLVVDTGIHAKHWTRQQAIDYLKTNTPNPIGDINKAIDRYIVMPSQATAYKIGMLKILELREKAKIQLGSRFDIRQFHDVVLKNGPLPLNALEKLVDQYIAQNIQ